MWKIKSLEVLGCHQKLIELLEWLKTEFGNDVITCAKRVDGSVHDTWPLRAIDVREWDENRGKHFEEFADVWWQYDHSRPEKKCVIYHDTGSGNHLHLQVHHNTRKRSLNTNRRFPV